MSANQVSSASVRTAQRIVPTLPPVSSDDNGSVDEGERIVSSEHGSDAIGHLEVDPTPTSYSILPPPQRVEPAETFEELFEPLQEHSEEDAVNDFRPLLGSSDEPYEDEDNTVLETFTDAYRPAFRPSLPPGRRGQASCRRSASWETPVDLPGAFNSTSNNTQSGNIASSTSREGQTSTSAIVIQDSPTPPLRPLASPQARLAASISGRCATLGDVKADVVPTVDEKKTTLGELVCPICLGPPSPLVITECGHTL